MTAHDWRRGRTRRYRTFGGAVVDVELVCRRCGTTKSAGDVVREECEPPAESAE